MYGVKKCQQANEKGLLINQILCYWSDTVISNILYKIATSPNRQLSG